MHNTRQIGNKGEDIACHYILNNGYAIIKRNYRTKSGEIDIIAKKDNVICFIEVKYRESLTFGYPREAVNYIKQKKIHKTALWFIKSNGNDHSSYRFDVIEIIAQGSQIKINHIENAF